MAIQAFLFERPLLLIPVLVAAQFVLIVVWSRRRTRKTRRLVWAGLVAWPVLVILNALVVTDRERLTGICRDLAEAVSRTDAEAFAEHISQRFQSDPGRNGTSWDKSALLQRVEGTVKTYRVEEPRLRAFEIDLDGDRATVRFAATCRIVTAHQI
ncbi:MAG: hypothetical protein ACYSUI_13585, partial [Planctomycetota bacterium]